MVSFICILFVVYIHVFICFILRLFYIMLYICVESGSIKWKYLILSESNFMLVLKDYLNFK